MQADERDSASPPPLPPPDFDESPASVPMASDFTDFTPFANGTLSAPSDTQMIGVPPSTELTLPLKSHFSSSAAQQKKSERLVNWSLRLSSTVKNRPPHSLLSSICSPIVFCSDRNVSTALKPCNRHGHPDTSRHNV